MTKSEEVFIILKRIPEQYKYLQELENMLFIIGCIPHTYPETYYIKKQKELKHRITNEKDGLIPSALGVFDNLIDRLNELVYDTNDN